MPQITTNSIKNHHTKKKISSTVQSESEAWPEEKAKCKKNLDEFQKMELEVKKEIEKDKKKKVKSKKKQNKENDLKEDEKASYENRNDATEKTIGPRVRSFDANKMKNKFSKAKEGNQIPTECKVCGKQVFQMERIVAEKSVWHKGCFRCKECNKFLSLENYQSHEGSVYCQPHFKELFRPKVVMQSEEEERLERLSRRPRLIVLESNPATLSDDVVRATSKPDYGLEELQTLNVKERFEMFENFNREEEQKSLNEAIPIKRSPSLMSKVARFLSEDPSEQNLDGENDESSEEPDEYEDDERGIQIVRGNKKKERPTSFAGMNDLKAVWEQKQRREEMSQARKEEVAKFRQLLCAGKNISLKEKFESGSFDEDISGVPRREEIQIDDKRAASNLRKRFEQGTPFILEDKEGEDDDSYQRNGIHPQALRSSNGEVEEIFKHADTAKQARNVFKQIDSKITEGQSPLTRIPPSNFQDKGRSYFETTPKIRETAQETEIVKSSDKADDFHVDTSDLANKFQFFMNYEKEQEKERNLKKKEFRITPPRDAFDSIDEEKLNKMGHMPKPCMAVNCEACKFRRMEVFEMSEMLGRDPNLIKCTDNYQDEIDCRNTKNILQMFRDMEMRNEEEEDVRREPRPLKCFTPPLDQEGSQTSEEEGVSDSNEEDDEDGCDLQPEIKDEILQMLTAKKAAGLRAKFERWQANEGTLNDKDKESEEDGMPSLDTAKNLRAMFELKANESTAVVPSKPVVNKINRFV